MASTVMSDAEFRALGVAEIFYVAPAKRSTVPEAKDFMTGPMQFAPQPDDIVYLLCGADGTQIAICGDQQTAEDAARYHGVKLAARH